MEQYFANLTDKSIGNESFSKIAIDDINKKIKDSIVEGTQDVKNSFNGEFVPEDSDNYSHNKVFISQMIKQFRLDLISENKKKISSEIEKLDKKIHSLQVSGDEYQTFNNQNRYTHFREISPIKIRLQKIKGHNTVGRDSQIDEKDFYTREVEAKNFITKINKEKKERKIIRDAIIKKRLEKENQIVNQALEKQNKERAGSGSIDHKNAGLYLPPINNKNVLKMSVDEKNNAIASNINNLKNAVLKVNKRQLSPSQVQLQNNITKINKEYAKKNRDKAHAHSLNQKPSTNNYRLTYDRSNLLPKIQSKYLDQIRKDKEFIINNENEDIYLNDDGEGVGIAHNLALGSNTSNKQITKSPYAYDGDRITRIMEIKKRYNISPKKIQDINKENLNMLDLKNEEGDVNGNFSVDLED